MAVIAADANIVINEMLANPPSDWNRNGEVSGMDDEFVELFNAGQDPIDISGYVVKDTVFRSTPGEYTIPNGTIVKQGGFLPIFVSSSGVFQGNDGDCIKLFDPSGNPVDEKITTPRRQMSPLPEFPMAANVGTATPPHQVRRTSKSHLERPCF